MSQYPSSQFRYLSEDTLSALHSLSPEDSIVLFTPVVPHPPDSDLQGQNVDPFEPLGRALSRYHARIRHVPYIPEIGLTKTLLLFFKNASAVIVVWCEPTSALRSHAQLYMPGSQNGTTKSFMGQMQFLKDTRKALYPTRAQANDRARVPLIVITTGPSGSLLDQNVGMHDYDTVLYCPYSAQALADLADTLYDGDLSNHQAAFGAASGEVSRLSLGVKKEQEHSNEIVEN